MTYKNRSKNERRKKINKLGEAKNEIVKPRSRMGQNTEPK